MKKVLSLIRKHIADVVFVISFWMFVVLSVMTVTGAWSRL